MLFIPIFLIFSSIKCLNHITYNGSVNSPSFFKVENNGIDFWLYEKVSTRVVEGVYNFDGGTSSSIPNIAAAIMQRHAFCISLPPDHDNCLGPNPPTMYFYKVSTDKEYYLLEMQLVPSDPLADIFRYPLADMYQPDYFDFTPDEFGYCSSILEFDPTAERFAVNKTRSEQLTSRFKTAIYESQVFSVVHSIYLAVLMGVYSNGFDIWEWNVVLPGYNSSCDVDPGDDLKYRPRGPIPIVGRCQYEEAARDLNNPDIVTDPDIVATDAVGFKTSVWLYKKMVSSQSEDYDFVSEDFNFLEFSLDTSRLGHLRHLFNNSEDVDHVFQAAQDWLQVCVYRMAIPFDSITLLFLVQLICFAWQGCL